MNPHTSDQEILLLAHGELTGWRTVAAQAHVAACARCQRRLTKLVGASRLLADAVRGRDLPRFPLATPTEALAAARIAIAWRLAAVLLLAGAGVGAFHARSNFTRSSVSHAHAADQSIPGGGCRPDLHSDKCR